TWAGAGGGGTRSADFLAGGGDFADAEGYGECNFAGGLAAVERNTGKAGGETGADFCLRGMRPSPWGFGKRFGAVGREVGKSGDLCFAGGVGGSDCGGVKRFLPASR